MISILIIFYKEIIEIKGHVMSKFITVLNGANEFSW
ncbi:hypothetical protein BJB63x_000040 [Bartonella sp. JB63]|nr:hypothetical protein BJB15x_000040 [Bartonella sp. JB15]AQX28708.1 hypothetical protein BJB63x_000040 [Bartonella sp. JB63]